MTKTYWFEPVPGSKVAKSVPAADRHEVADDGRVRLLAGDRVVERVPAGARWGCTTVSEIMP